MKVLAKSTGTMTFATCSVCWRHAEGISMYWYMSWTVLMLHIILCYVPVLGEWLLLMKDSGGERMHYPYASSHLLILMLEVNVGIVSVLTLAGDVYGWKCPKSSQIRSG